MKAFVQVTCCLVLAALFASSGNAMPPGDNMRAAGGNAKSVDLAGKISDDAKSFLADDGNQWTISNVAAVKGHEGRDVVLQCRMDLEKRALHVLGIRPEQSQKARMGDAAFRR